MPFFSPLTQNINPDQFKRVQQAKTSISHKDFLKVLAVGTFHTIPAENQHLANRESINH